MRTGGTKSTNVAVAGMVVAAIVAAPHPAAAASLCPLLVSHGWYDRGKDHILPMNNPGAGLGGLPGHPKYSWFEQQDRWGADYVEGDLRFTRPSRDGSVLVMWHNKTMNGLDVPGASKKLIREQWWSSIAGEKIKRSTSVTTPSPYKGKEVWSLRAWIGAVKGAGLRPVIEIKTKPTAAQYAAIRAVLTAAGAYDKNTRVWGSDADKVGWPLAAPHKTVLAEIRSELPGVDGNAVRDARPGGLDRPADWAKAVRAGYKTLYVDGGIEPTGKSRWTKTNSSTNKSKYTARAFIDWAKRTGACVPRKRVDLRE